ncbi:hypothetical protein QJ527_00495 [Enterococcus mundtii]|uniref:hypothetical protein n=3 Tax=Enterococcus TaxID=1350 RepID=UPI0004519EFC|nr:MULTISPECIES: hypothetical protein [Enterococcus]AZP93679.1 hypothetical protein CYK55_11610 [Enterococcus mundtii]EYT96952.1 hypothetical protein AK89_01175 [Enterococcus mundtii CRL35]MDA9428258.1 hypothetical protein [Enterococcus mundtii 1A]MDK4210027.1 hypothetical protein [Enterococcus mundtii]MDO7878400.1 hypothetical protein [Enterococcus mundtii]
MTYEVKVSKEILNIFSENQSKRYQEIILYKLKEYLMHNFYRIKRVDAPVKQSIYEMKIRLGKENFRIAFIIEDKRVQVFYISRTLKKELFDKEVNRVVHRFNKNHRVTKSMKKVEA